MPKLEEILRNLYINGSYQCSTYNIPLTRIRYRLFGFTYSIFVYVGTVSVGIHVDLGVSFDALVTILPVEVQD